MPEITHHCQKTPFLLVGTQIDLRDDAGMKVLVERVKANVEVSLLLLQAQLKS